MQWIFWTWLAGVVFWSVVLSLPLGGERHGGSRKWLVFNVLIWPYPTVLLIIAVLMDTWRDWRSR